jgi:uncharacterized membrane protein
MSDSAARTLRLGMLAAIALLALQIVWHAWLAPPKSLWPGLALALAPLLPGLWAARSSLRRGLLISGIVCLFYFSHGIAELWSGSAPRWLALVETLLTLIVIGALGWDARGYKRARKSPLAANDSTGA